MINLFKLLSKHEKNLTMDVSNKEWWETKNIDFEKNALSPDGKGINEQEIYESIKKSDLERLRRFSK